MTKQRKRGVRLQAALKQTFRKFFCIYLTQIDQKILMKNNNMFYWYLFSLEFVR
jgi:hypothetical protein